MSMAEQTASRPRIGGFPGRRGSGGWLTASALVAVLVFLPIAALALIAAGGSGESWRHVFLNVVPSALPTTAILLCGVGAIVVAIGTGTAWLVTAYEFPGRRILDWALLLPMAMPTYVVAFAYLELLHPIGPVQTAMRSLLGIASPRDFRLPDIRSLGGAIVLFSLVLYPYVYLATRALFLMQAAGCIEAARTLGAGPFRLFLRIALPLARPAIAIGASLALMETLNDVGASEFLGIRTLTLSIYSTWVNQSDLPGAAGIALFMLAIVLGLVALERAGRRRQRYAAATQRSNVPERRRLDRGPAVGAAIAGWLPVVLGFVLPAAYLASAAAARIGFAGISGDILHEALNTLAAAAVATAVAVALGLVVAYAARLDRGALGTMLLRLASLGYALPGTVLAIGLFVPLAAFDNLIDEGSRRMFGVSTGLLIAGSGAALIYAYVARFLAVSAGGIEAGLTKVPRSLDESARTLGRTAGGVLRQVHLPLIRPAIGAAAILVFVDCMKELPATLLLRPLNFETLATHLYGEAARGTYEDGALAALAIVVAGLLPVLLLARLSRSAIGAAGGRRS
jgi:iron(III) transport system permease protein